MIAVHPLPPSSAVAVALCNIANGKSLTNEEAKLVDSTMPQLMEEDLRTDAAVDPELELAYLAGELASDPAIRTTMSRRS